MDSETRLQEIVPEVAKTLEPARKIGIYGELGAGKTAFVRAFCRHLGVTGNTSSPTFSLVNEYRYRTAAGEQKVHHLDLYRLHTLEEALDIGVEELLDDPWFCLIEWPELIEPIFPPTGAKIRMEVLAQNARRLIIL